MYCIVQTTFQDRAVGDSIIHRLLEQNLAACIHEQAIKSHYRWEGDVVHEDETLLLIKSRSELFEDIKRVILELHDYQTPEIIMLKIADGYRGYFDWIDAAVQRVGES
jgi:periplasmic divalent cation tolerance protein